MNDVQTVESSYLNFPKAVANDIPSTERLRGRDQAESKEPMRGTPKITLWLSCRELDAVPRWLESLQARQGPAARATRP